MTTTIKGPDGKPRCRWCAATADYLRYHDKEWGFPVGDDIRDIVVDWVDYLRREKEFGPDDPLFPKTRVAPGPDHEFCVMGLDCAHWSNADPVRAIFRQSFERAGLAYVNPHSCRDTLVQLA